MKRILLLLSILTFPLYAYADFVPGRTRASAQGDLVRSQGDGRYQNVAGARALQLQTDGKGVTGFQLSLDRRPAIAFVVRSIQPNRCGRTFHAEVTENGHATALRIDELSAEACRDSGKLRWNAMITTDEGGGSASHLALRGDAEYFLLSQ